MRVLVTGANGFLGRHLTHALVHRGDFVVALVRDATWAPDEVRMLDTSTWDYLASATVRGGYEQVERAAAEYEVDAVVHLAAQTQVSTAVKDPIGTWEANVAGTWRVLEACRRQGVERVVVASSDKVYSDGPTPYREDQPLEADGVYSTSKVCADMIAQCYAHEFDLQVAITRCGNLYGPGHTNWSTLIPGTFRSLLRGERPRLRSTSALKRDYLHVDDAVDAYLRLIDRRRPGRAEVFNFGTGVGSVNVDVVAAACRTVGIDLEPVFDISPSLVGPPLEIVEQVLDASLARAELGWAPRHDLASGLAATVEWYRNYLGVKR